MYVDFEGEFPFWDASRGKSPVLQAFGGFYVFFYGLGVTIYAFAGIGIILPLE